MYDTIVVGVDGSDPAGHALEEAISLGATVGATVHVVMVVEPSPQAFMFGIDEVDAINQGVDDLIEELVEERDTTEVIGAVRRGRPAPTLLSYAHDEDADVLVVGKRGTQDLGEAILGSTTDRLARTTDIPLHIIPEP